MKELSLNILDIVQNSITAKASLVTVTLTETETELTIAIGDNGCGMSEEMVKNVVDPFCTTRTTRKVGLGIPLFRLAAEQTGGSLSVTSKTAEADPVHHGTTTTASFHKDHLDFTPLGDVISTMCTIVQGAPQVDFVFTHTYLGNLVSFDTRELREQLGEIPLDTPEVLVWLKEYLQEQYQNLYSIEKEGTQP